MKQYVSLMDNTHDIVKHRTETAFISLVFAVFACGAPIVFPDRMDDGGMGMIYYERCVTLGLQYPPSDKRSTLVSVPSSCTTSVMRRSR